MKVNRIVKNITPLLLLSVGLILYCSYAVFFIDGGEEDWGTLAAMVGVVVGFAALIVYIILRLIFRKRYWYQVAFEIILLGGLYFYNYKREGRMEFQLPRNYRGYVILVYDVKGAPKLQGPFFKNKMEIVVPESGIILTSSHHSKYFNRSAKFIDSDLGEIRKLPDGLKRSDIPYADRQLECGVEKYVMLIWYIKDKPSMNAKEDSVNGLEQKVNSICNMIPE